MTLAAGVLVGCSSDGPKVGDVVFDGPACADVVGKVFTADEWNQGCDAGENRFEGTGSVVCKDGRTIYWNVGGWAYLGDVAQPAENGGVPSSVYWGDCLQVPTS